MERISSIERPKDTCVHCGAKLHNDNIHHHLLAIYAEGVSKCLYQIINEVVAGRNTTPAFY